MNLVIFPLRPEMKGPAVADLQDALLLILDRRVILADDENLRAELTAKIREERGGPFFGEATRKCVSVFQQQRDVQPEEDGAVDEVTARAINDIVRDLAPPDQLPPERPYIVSGQVRRADALPLDGVRVQAFHEDEQGAIRLGEDTADAAGRYTIRYQLLPGVAAVNLRVTVVAADGQALQSSDLVPGANPVQMIDVIVPVAEQAATQRRIDGRIMLDHGLPAAGMTVRLYRREFGGTSTKLAESPTDANGLYALRFDAGTKPVNLEIRAVGADGHEATLANALPDLGDNARAAINLIGPAALQPLAPEYRRLVGDLTPHLNGDVTKLAQTQENADRQDLTVLNQATGWDARLIALAATAAKLGADETVGLPPKALYGLFRVGLPSDKLQLAQVAPAAVEQALKKVADTGIVDLSADEIVAARTKFEGFARETRLAVPAPGSRSTYKDLLERSGLDGDTQNKFADLYLDHAPNADLWQAAREQNILDEGQIQRLQLQGKLAFLAGNSAGLTSRLQSQITDPAELAAKDYFLPTAWEAEIRAEAGVDAAKPFDQLSPADQQKVGDLIPTAFGGETVGEKLAAYTEDMARKIRRSYPTHVVARMIEKDDADGLKLGEAKEPTAAFLKNAAASGFQLGITPVEQYRQAHPDAIEAVPEDQRGAAIQGAKTVQRVYQISPGNDVMQMLLGQGITSAYDVVSLPWEAFWERYGDKFGSIEQAKLVYRKAQQVSSVTYNLFTMAKKLDSEAQVYGISAPPEARETLKTELIKQFPTMESLFGSLDYCECEHCQSVLSPAAYLVDLLQFVDPEPLVWDNFLTLWAKNHGEAYAVRYKKPYDALIERRPDIPQIPLTCENTETALPYIDIVNEILEYYVANERLAGDAARDTGDATTEELLAEPQNIISDAYAKLERARYPLSLPFDLWLETTRRFCDYFETPLWRLLETFRAGDALFAEDQPYDRADIFIESLGLSPGECAIFTDPDPLADDRWFDLYGYPRDRPVIDAPTNDENATVTIPDDVAAKLGAGIVCTYFDISAGALHPETLEVRSLGPQNPAAAGQTVVTFVGTWTTAPAAGDLLVVAAPAMLASAKTLSRRLGVTYKEFATIVETGFVNPDLRQAALLAKIGVAVHDVMDYAANKAYYDANKDLIGKDRNALPPADQQRYDQVTADKRWADLGEAQAFEARLDAASAAHKASGFDARQWLQDALAAKAFDRMLLLATPAAGCDFGKTTLRYAGGDPADAIAFLKINLFVRLWRKLGWTIDETDRALEAFLPKNAPFDAAHLNESPLRTALMYLAHLKALDAHVGVGKQSRLKLLTLWSPIAVTGKNALYGQLFLRPNVLKSDAVFDDPLGAYLAAASINAQAAARTFEASLEHVAAADQIDPAVLAGHPEAKVAYDAGLHVQELTYRGVLTDADKAALAALSPSPALKPLLEAVQDQGKNFSLIKGRLPALQGALGLAADEIRRILDDAGQEPATPGLSLENAVLSLENVSLLYRYRLLANALKLSVGDLIGLKQLSNVDPFGALPDDPVTKLEDDRPFWNTMRFVEMANRVDGSGLSVEDLTYLLRHQFDETSKYRPDPAAQLALAKTLAEGIRAIRAEQAMPADPAAIDEEMLRQKLSLALPPDVTTRFLAMLNGSADFTAIKLGVEAVAALNPAAFAGETAIRELTYDAAAKKQRLVYRGVLLDAQKDDLAGRLPKPVPLAPFTPSPPFIDLLNDVETQARAFFDRNLQKPAPGDPAGNGFLDAADYELLFGLLPPELTDEQRQARQRDRLSRVVNAFLPFLRDRLIRRFLVQTLSAQFETDPSLIDSLLAEDHLLGISQPLLDPVAAVDDRGVDIAFLDGAGQQLEAVVAGDADTGLKDKDGVPIRPAAAVGARLEGYLEVAAPGAYRFSVACDRQGAEVDLRFEQLPAAYLDGAAGADNAELSGEPLALSPGPRFHFTLTAKKLNGGDVRLLVEGDALPKDTVAQLLLHPLSASDRADRALLLLAKIVQLVQALNLSERELRYLLANPADFGPIELGKLPTRETDDAPAQAHALFAQFLRLAGYARLKRDLAGGTEDLIDAFAADAPGALQRIAGLARREVETVSAAAAALFPAPVIKNEQTLQRLWEALQVVERLGAPVAALTAWSRIVGPGSTPKQRFAIARDLKDTIKARFDVETWQRVAQPTFDDLRRRQRDALVAHAMQQLGVPRADQLYEYFLIDPGMEPVVQTSRIRLAIGAVQLFIQRCLLNLEPHVHPSAINASQWEWMKRYRVWEANRKIFLFPENWLEPEFRDDKTDLFSELEGNLLQADVSSDLVEDAFLTYLTKLEDRARLNIVGLHVEDNPDPALRALHVIGRTYGEPHNYFYRRYAQESWTPWEPVTAEIEGDHLAPVIWRDRLYLFWVTFVEQVERPPAAGGGRKAAMAHVGSTQQAATVELGPKEDKVTELTPSEIRNTALAAPERRTVDVQLHWSAYLNGDWSPVQSVGVTTPTPVRQTGLSNFSRQDVFIHVVRTQDDSGRDEVAIHLDNPINQAFRLVGRNSPPQQAAYAARPLNPYPNLADGVNGYTGTGNFSVTFRRRIAAEDGKTAVETSETLPILAQAGPYRLLPCDNDITLGGTTSATSRQEIASLLKPLFFQDSLNTLFIEPNVEERTVEEWQEWVTTTPKPDWHQTDSEWWKHVKIVSTIPEYRPPRPIDPFWNPGDLTIDPQPEHDWLVNPSTSLIFDGELIGAAGRQGLQIVTTAAAAQAIAAGGRMVNIQPGSGLAAGSVVISEDGAKASTDLQTLAGGRLSVIGAGGVSRGVLERFNVLTVAGLNGALAGGLVER